MTQLDRPKYMIQLLLPFLLCSNVFALPIPTGSAGLKIEMTSCTDCSNAVFRRSESGVSLLERVLYYGEEPTSPQPKLPGKDGIAGVVVDPVTKKIVGNGAWITPCDFATNHHVVFRKGQHVSSNITVEIHVGSGDLDDGFAESVLAQPVAWGDFCSTDQKRRGDDWTILHAKSCLGQKYGWASPSSKPSEQLHHQKFFFLNAYSLVNDGRAGVSRCTGEVRGTVLDPLPAIAHKCDSYDYSSGTPLIANIAGRTTLLALHMGPGDSTYPPSDPRSFNRAIPLSLFYNRLADLLQSEAQQIRADADPKYVAPERIPGLDFPGTTSELRPRYQNCRDESGPSVFTAENKFGASQSRSFR